MNFAKTGTLDESTLISDIRSANSQSLETLIAAYLPLINRIAARFAASGEHEDIVQEGIIGLMSAIRRFDSSLGYSFSAFASVCVKNRIISFIKKENLHFHLPLEDYDGESLYTEFSDTDLSFNPEAAAIRIEENSERFMRIKSLLSGFEQDILMYYLAGGSYLRIAERLGVTVKSVDNALSRVKRKLRGSV